MEQKKVTKINGPVIVATGEEDIAMHDMVYIGKNKLMGEVIKLEGKSATIQVYEDTSGMHIGEEVISTGGPLSLTLGPGLIGSVFDGIQRPLKAIEEKVGSFIQKGIQVNSLDENKKWHFVPSVSVGDLVQYNSILGTVKETESITHKILYPNFEEGKIIEISQEGEYSINDIIAKIQSKDGKIHDITMVQKWAVRKQRPYKKRLQANIPLITGQRVIDSIFPITKGGTAAIPGGFGTGKTVLQHQLAKWCDADIIVYIGCGERGNEMTEVLEDFPKLTDPRTGRPLMERTILIANTSNMPVAARETSIYTGITIAEYYRDMGYQVAIMADSTSRWAEALREISGRLEEMPAEEGYPSYLPSRLSEFYGRAGRTLNNNGTEGSVTIIGAVSPQGSDFSEPVTQNTRRFVHVFWGLDRGLAYSRHYPAIDWMISYSEYVSNLENWYEKNVEEDFLEYRGKIIKLLNEENELQEIAKVVGQSVLSDSKKLILETSKCIREGFLQQNAKSEIDTYVPLLKQYKMMKLLIDVYELADELVEKGIPMSTIKQIGFFAEYSRIKNEISNIEMAKIDELEEKYINELNNIEEEYKDFFKKG